MDAHVLLSPVGQKTETRFNCFLTENRKSTEMMGTPSTVCGLLPPLRRSPSLDEGGLGAARALSNFLLLLRVQGRNPGRFNGGYGVPRGFKGGSKPSAPCGRLSEAEHPKRKGATLLRPLSAVNSKSPPNPLGLAERVYSFHRPRGGPPPSKREVLGFRRSRPPALPSITYRGFAVAPITLRAPSRRVVVITSGTNGRAMRAPTGYGDAAVGCKCI